MIKEVCEQCLHVDTELCDTCEKRVCRVCGCTLNLTSPKGHYWVEFDLCSKCAETETLPPKMTYTFYLPENIYDIDNFHNMLDKCVSSVLGMDVIRSILASYYEYTEHDIEERLN